MLPALRGVLTPLALTRILPRAAPREARDVHKFHGGHHAPPVACMRQRQRMVLRYIVDASKEVVKLGPWLRVIPRDNGAHATRVDGAHHVDDVRSHARWTRAEDDATREGVHGSPSTRSHSSKVMPQSAARYLR